MFTTADISVVIPCYNAAKTIVRALDSVINQTLLPREIIIGDDCSNDDSLAIIENYKNNYRGPVEIMWVTYQENSGSAKARNVAWDKAEGEYVAFLDADDSWHYNKLHIQYTYMKENRKYDICGHKFEVIDEVNDFYSDDRTFSDVEELTPFKMFVESRMCTPSVMLKRKIPLRFQVFKNHSVDFLLWMEILFNGYKGCVLNGKFCFLHKDAYGAGGVSANMSAMWKGALANHKFLYKKGHINIVVFLTMSSIDTLKYIRRVVLLKFK